VRPVAQPLLSHTHTHALTPPLASFVHGRDHRYRRNLKRLYILHPTWWVWLAITIVNTFLISDVREKIQMVDSLQILYDHVPPSQVKVPDFVLDYDRRYYGEVTNAVAGNPDSL